MIAATGELLAVAEPAENISSQQLSFEDRRPTHGARALDRTVVVPPYHPRGRPDGPGGDLPSLDVGPSRAWADDFIVKGNNGQDKEKRGAIEVMAPNFADVLATLTIKQIGILELTPTDDTSIRSHRAGMYFEYGQLSYP